MERTITRQTKALLDTIKKQGAPLHYFKISDRFTSGIPDFVGVYNGRAFYIELKDVGEKPRKLQRWQLEQLKKAGAKTLATDTVDDVVEFLYSLTGIEA